MLTDSTYYVNDIAINAGQYSTLDASIARYEKEILNYTLGYELAKLVIAYDEQSEQRIKDLVEGKEYTIDGVLYNWNGLINTDLVSLLSYWVYYQHMKQNRNYSTPTGQISPMNENAEKVDMTWALLDAYNKCGSLIEDMYSFIKEHESDYPEIVKYNYLPNITKYIL